MKRIKRIALWVGLLVYLICITAFVGEQQRKVVCNGVKIKITDSTDHRFIKAKDINSILLKSKIEYLGKPLAAINTDTLEKIVLTNTLVKTCKVFTTIDGKLNVELQQRDPVVRIIDSKGMSYYLDAEGYSIAMSYRYTPHLLVVNGNINTPFHLKKVENIFDRKFAEKTVRLREIHELASFIRGHDFWNAQIVQIYVNKKGEYELVPRVGPHLIILGKAEGYREKFDKLWLFYNEGLNKVGWNNYLKINLKYKDQIVCTKI